MAPEISVIIPLYNKGSHVARAIDSVLSQTVQDFEIIIMDGNSTDEGPEIVKNYRDPRIYFHVQEGSGVSAARNQGVKRSHTGFIAFLDADDEWMPDHLEVLSRLKDKFPGAGIYSTAYQMHTLSENPVRSHSTKIPPSCFEGILPDYFESAALGENPVWTSAAGMQKNLFFESGGFQEDVSLGEDIDLWAKIALKYPVAFHSVITAVYHIEASNRACLSFRSLEELAFVKNAKKALADKRVPRNMISPLKKYIERKEIDTAKINIFAGDYRSAGNVLARIDTRFFLAEKLLWGVILRIPGRFLILSDAQENSSRRWFYGFFKVQTSCG